MSSSRARKHPLSMSSDSSSCSSPERVLEDDYDIMEHTNESESSLSVSLEDMDLDSADFERRCRDSPISRLPAELVIAIFSKLGSPADLQNCMLVSKSWARNSVDLLWYRPSTDRWKKLINVIQTATKRDGFFLYHDLIKRLNLGQLKYEVSDGVLMSLAACKRIERLTLPGCVKLTDLSVREMIDGNRSLMAIDVSDLECLTDITMNTIAKNCYRLQGLNVSNCKGITDESLVAVAKNCRRIKRLKLNDCGQITDISVMAFADNCQDILEIDLSKCANVTDAAVYSLITRGRQLRELRLPQCSRISDEAFLQLPSNEHFDALRVLDLTDCNELQDAGLQKIVSAAPRLRNLVLAKCRNITDRGVLAITRLTKNLHFLHLGHCGNITDYGVSHLVKYCNRIRYIDFSCCTNLTDDSVSMLATLPKLKRIGLVKCANITDRSIRALAQLKPSTTGHSYTNSLERLHLSYCTNLTINGVRTMLRNCPQLTHLSLTGVPPFLRDDLLRFSKDAPKDFNDHQRDVFCVFSGPGVVDLRNYLIESYPSPTPSDVDIDDDDIRAVSDSGNLPGPPTGVHIFYPPFPHHILQQMNQMNNPAGGVHHHHHHQQNITPGYGPPQYNQPPAGQQPLPGAPVGPLNVNGVQQPQGSHAFLHQTPPQQGHRHTHTQSLPGQQVIWAPPPPAQYAVGMQQGTPPPPPPPPAPTQPPQQQAQTGQQQHLDGEVPLTLNQLSLPSDAEILGMPVDDEEVEQGDSSGR